MRYDVVVVGAGPAGLSAAAELAVDRATLLVEAGPPAPDRRRDAPADLLAGVGGAGLFSDGKHSFFPSASALWTLPDRDALAAAFDGTAALLRDFGVDAGALPSSAAPPATGQGWQPKLYPARYIGFADRLAIIERLWNTSADRWHHARVVDAARDGDELVLAIDRAGACREVRTRQLVIATGRWSPRWLRPWLEPLGVRFAFQRVEVGVRIETAADHPLFARLPGTDGKLTLRASDTTELRTFCTCRDGEVMLGTAGGLAAYSGRADGPPTGRSNVGLVVRELEPEVGHATFDATIRPAPARFPLAEWLHGGAARLAPLVGPTAAAALTEGLAQLGFTGEGTVYAPCIEGIGDYPVTDGALAAAPGISIAGDAHGRFRGIVAGMISGRYVARTMR